MDNFFRGRFQNPQDLPALQKPVSPLAPRTRAQAAGPRVAPGSVGSSAPWRPVNRLQNPIPLAKTALHSSARARLKALQEAAVLSDVLPHRPARRGGVFSPDLLKIKEILFEKIDREFPDLHTNRHYRIRTASKIAFGDGHVFEGPSTGVPGFCIGGLCASLRNYLSIFSTRFSLISGDPPISPSRRILNVEECFSFASMTSI